MVTNPNTKDLYEEKDKVILQHDEKQRILSGITSNPAYIDRATNPDAYRDYLKDFLDKEKIIDVLVIGGKKLPPKRDTKNGGALLSDEEYLVKLTDAKIDAQKVSDNIIFKRLKEEKDTNKDAQLDEVEELKKKLATSQDELGQQKDLNAKLGEAIDGGNKNETALKAQLATSEARRKQAIFEPVGNPGAAKLNTKLVRIQILTPGDVRRRMHLTKLANQIGKHEATDPTGQNPEKGLRYLMADSGFRGGITGIAALKRSRREMREDARNNPDLFKRKFKAKFDNRLPKDDDIKRPDEKYYLAFIKESMNYYRNLFLWNQAEKIVGKDVLKLTTKPQKPKILTMPRAEDYALAA